MFLPHTQTYGQVIFTTDNIDAIPTQALEIVGT
jgi:hypothetical protein